MSQQTILILAALAVVAVVVFASSKKDKPADFDIPPAPQRDGILFGYFGCKGPQVAETRGTVNLIFDCMWDGLDGAIANLRTAQLPAVIDVADCLFTPPVRISPDKSEVHPRGLKPDAEQRLRGMFDRLRAEGVLQWVRYIAPTDEPNLPQNNAIGALPAAIELIRRVALDYAELADVGIWVTYFSGRPMDHIEIVDVASFDDYGEGPNIFAPGALYEQMRARLRPDQRTAIFPGATYGQDPAPFLNFANAHPEVLAIVAFLWREPGQGNPFTGIHCMPEMRAKYEALGRLIVGAHA